jgi:Tfp pilus assembly protein PilO
MSLRLNYQGKIFLSLLFFLIMFFGLTFFFIAPTLDNVKMIKKRISDQRQEAEKNYDQGRNLKKLTENIKTIEPRLEEIEQIFVPKNEEVSFITSLEAAAARNNVSENVNSGGETPVGRFYSQIPLQLTVRGNPVNVVNFITELENMKNRININSLQITAMDSDLSLRTGSSTPQKNVTALISTLTYWKN